MRIFFILTSLILIGSVFASEEPADFEDYGFDNAFSEFISSHKNSILNLTNSNALNDSAVLGLEISDSTREDWATLSQKMTNVLSLRIWTRKAELTKTLFAAITNYTRLEYVHIQCGRAVAIPEHINLLTNLIHLRYLGLVAPMATNIDAGIYQNRRVKELLFSIGATQLPNGIAQLSELEYLEIFGKNSLPIRGMPADFSKSTIRRLLIGNVTNLAEILPNLPEQLVRLAAVNCRLTTVPAAWVRAPKLELINLNGNEIAHFPTELLTLPSVRLIALDSNKITNLPPIIFPGGRTVKIELFANPIQHFAPENEVLVQRGIIQK